MRELFFPFQPGDPSTLSTHTSPGHRAAGRGSCWRPAISGRLRNVLARPAGGPVSTAADTGGTLNKSSRSGWTSLYFLFNDDEIPAEQVTQPLLLFAPAPLQLFPRLRHGVYELSFLLQAFGVKLDAATFVEPTTHRLTISLGSGGSQRVIKVSYYS